MGKFVVDLVGFSVGSLWMSQESVDVRLMSVRASLWSMGNQSVTCE